MDHPRSTSSRVLEGLQEGDQRLLVSVPQLGAEIMTAVDDIIRAFAERKQLLAEIGEYLTCLLVGRALWQCPQIMQQLNEESDHRLVMHQSLDWLRRLRQRVEIGHQIYWSPCRDRTDLYSFLIKDRNEPVQHLPGSLDHIGQVAGGYAQPACRGRPVDHPEDLVAQPRILGSFLGPQHLRDRVLEDAHARLDRRAWVERTDVVVQQIG